MGTGQNGMVTKKAEDQRFDIVIEDRVEVLKPGFDKVDIRICHTTTMLEMQKIRPLLHIIMKSGVALLVRPMEGCITKIAMPGWPAMEARSHKTWYPLNSEIKWRVLLVSAGLLALLVRA